MKQKVIKFDNGEKIKSVATNYEEGFVTIEYEDSGWKKGDILTRIDKFGWILIFDELVSGRLLPIVDYRCSDGVVTYSESHDAKANYRLATPSEKEILFEALKKEGKIWNSDKKVLEDIKPEHKEGDILYGEIEKIKFTFIFKDYRYYGGLNYHYYMSNSCNDDGGFVQNSKSIRPATPEEKVAIYTHLAKRGMYFSKSENKLINFNHA